MSTRRLLFTGGMAAALPPEMCPESAACNITNLRLGIDGTWSAVPDFTKLDGQETLLQGFLRTYTWSPVYLPADCIDDHIFIAFSATECCYLYRTAANAYSIPAVILDGINGAHVRAVWDATQFLFVDGRAGGRAKRILVEANGTIVGSDLGVAQPTQAPVVNAVLASPTSRGEHTLVPVGATLYYTFCCVNKFGERGNPSPVAIYSQHHRMQKGAFVENDYTYSEEHTGEIVSVHLTCTIDHPELTDRVELYRAFTEYTEESDAYPQPVLVRSVVTNGASSVIIADISPASIQAADSENDVAPAGDDIAISGGTIFIGNAVSMNPLPALTTRAWSIVIPNTGQLNYSNQWFYLALLDKTHGIALSQPYLDGLDNWNDADVVNYQFLAGDLATNLSAFYYPQATEITMPDGETCHTNGMFLVQIPYVPALQDTVIYLAQIPGVNMISTLASPSMLPLSTRVSNPVRSAMTAYAGMTDQLSNLMCTYNPESKNRANHYNDWVEENVVVGTDGEELRHDGFYTKTLSNRLYLSHPTPSTTNGISASLENSGLMTRGGFAYVGIKFNHTDNVVNNVAYHKVLSLGNESTNIAIFYWRDASKAIILGRIYRNSAPDKRTFVYAQADLPAGGSWDDYAWLYISWDKQVKEGEQIETPMCVSLYQYYATSTSTILPLIASGTEVCARFSASDPETAMDTFLTDGGKTLTLYHGDPVAEQFPVPPPALGEPPIMLGFNLAYITPDYAVPHFMGPYVQFGSYVSDPFEVQALHTWDTLMPSGHLGWRGEIGLNGDQAVAVNAAGLSISPVVIDAERSAGRIRWSRGGAVPDLHERNIFDEVTRIVPIKSFMPVVEHATILIWTTSGRLYRMLLDSANELSSIVVERENVPLTSPDALAVTRDGVVWQSPQTLYFYSEAGLKDIGTYRVFPGDYSCLPNPAEHEVMFIPATGTVMLVYNAANDTWAWRDHGRIPGAYFTHRNQICIFDAATGALMGAGIDRQVYLSGSLTTGGIDAHPARIRRIWLRGKTADLFAIQARIHHHRVTPGYTDSPLYGGRANAPLAIPNLSGDLVQFIVSNIDQIKYIDIEDNNNNG